MHKFLFRNDKNYLADSCEIMGSIQRNFRKTKNKEEFVFYCSDMPGQFRKDVTIIYWKFMRQKVINCLIRVI